MCVMAITSKPVGSMLHSISNYMWYTGNLLKTLSQYGNISVQHYMSLPFSHQNMSKINRNLFWDTSGCVRPCTPIPLKPMSQSVPLYIRTDHVLTIILIKRAPTTQQSFHDDITEGRNTCQLIEKLLVQKFH